MMWLLDLCLAAVLLTLAWQALHTRNLFTGIVMFMIFGLIVSLIWVRLEALDVALAEAAIGAGITGVLLLSTRAAIADKQDDRASQASSPHKEDAAP